MKELTEPATRFSSPEGELSAGSPRRLVRSAVLRVIAGPDAGLQVAIGPAPIVIGSAEGCDLSLKDPRVSRRHLELALVAEGVAVKDLGSTNGVTLRGARLSEAVVPIGAVLELGKTQLQLAAPSRPPIPPSARTGFGGLAGEGVLMREIFAVLELVSPTDATVLLRGESGTGKELVARAIHDHSKRAAGPFVIVDCGATQPSLIESAFFGHKKGAFTGALDDRKGAFVSADGGTVFLDEIGELPPEAQAKLLRVLDSKTVQPVGSDQRIVVDARVIAATHRDLEAMVVEGQFRFDLFHRLSVVRVDLPPLRDRLEDLPCLVRRFFQDRGLDPGEIDGDNLAALRGYDWPGNVRELRNVLERGFVFSGSTAPRFRDLLITLAAGRARPAPFVDTSRPFKEAKDAWLAVFEEQYVRALHRAHGGNITQAARAAGLDRGHFRALVTKYGIEPA